MDKNDEHSVEFDPVRRAIVEKNAHNGPANRLANIKAIEAKYPPYNVKALRTGIQDKRVSIGGLEAQIKKLNREITHFQQLAKQCEQRDKELAPYMDGVDSARTG